MNKNLYLDLDGPLIDSCGENLYNLETTWKLLFNGDRYPLSKTDFRNLIRPYITSPADFYSFTLAYMNGVKFRKDSEVEAVRTRYADISEAGLKAYRAARKDFRFRQPREWFRMQPPADGVDVMFSELKKMKSSNRGKKNGTLNIFIVSSRDDASVRDIAEYNGFPVDRTYGDTMGTGQGRFSRGEQLIVLRSMLRPVTSILYDDSAENLWQAVEADAVPFAAPQGYGTSRALSHFVKAWPRELPGIVRKTMDL